MKELFEIRHLHITAWKLEISNIKSVEGWCNGSIKGTKLPPEERVVEIWDTYLDCEKQAEIGDYVVRRGDGTFTVMTDSQIHSSYVNLTIAEDR